MKWIKRIFVTFFVLFVILVGFLLLAPILFKDQIVANVKSSLNQMVEAEVDFADVDVSFLSSFPDIAVDLEKFSVIGIDTFAGLPLLEAEEVGIDLGFWSVITDDGFRIEAVELERPVVNLKVLSPELANYLIVAEDSSTVASDPAAAPASSPLINLDHFEISDGTFVYDDRTTGTYIKIEGLNTTGDGDFTSSVFDLDTYSEADALTLRQDGTTYLNGVRTIADAIIGVDLDQSLYTFKDNKITMNALELVFGGDIQLDGDDILFDLTYEAPSNDFRQVWSMIPSAYVAGFEDVRTQGRFTLSGTVLGPFNSEREVYPAFTVKSEISDGSVQYPGRPIGVTGIDASVDVNSPSADLNQLKVNIPRFNFNLGGDPFNGSFRLATPLSDPNVDLRLDGKLDLGKWAQAVPLEGVSELAGVILADVTMQGVRQSAIDAGNYAGLDMSGALDLLDLVYVADDLPPVRVPEAKATFNPKAVEVPTFRAQLGRSDLAGSASFTNPLAYFNPEQTMRGDVTLNSNYFDADEWMPTETETVASPAEMQAAASAQVAETEIFDRFDFGLDANIKRLTYGEYQPENLAVNGRAKPNDLVINSMSGQLGESRFSGSGEVLNLFDYTFSDGVLGGVLNLNAPFLDVADFMVEEPATAGDQPATTEDAPAGESAAIPVPKNINLAVNVAADLIRYDNIDLRSTRGQMLVRDGRIVVEEGVSSLLGGVMNFAGAYDTSEPGDPGFRFHYDLKSLDFKQAFDKLNTFAALAPIGKYVEGTFNSDLIMEGKLGEDLFPKLETIDAEGLFATVSAQLNSFGPLQKIGNALNVEELKNSTALRNIMTVFKIEDGLVTVNPFDVNLIGIPMRIQGTHGLNQDMSYAIRASIPRDKISGNALANTALTAVDGLASRLGKLGLNVSPGDTLNVNINLTGNVSDPKVKFDLLGTSGGGGGSASDAVKDAAEAKLRAEADAARAKLEAEAEARRAALEAEAQAKLDALKADASDRAAAARDSIQRAARARAAALKAETERRLQARLDSIARLDSLANLVPPDVRDAANRVKDDLGKFNPFKKKKD